MEFKKYILKKFDYDVNVSNKKFYTPDETITQKLGINVKFLENKKNVKLTFRINILDKEKVNIFKLKIEYILVLDQEPPEISAKLAEEIVTAFYPILNEVINSFYNINGLKDIKLPEF